MASLKRKRVVRGVAVTGRKRGLTHLEEEMMTIPLAVLVVVAGKRPPGPRLSDEYKGTEVGPR